VEPQTTAQPQLTAEYDHRGGDPEITFRNGGPDGYADVVVTIDRSRTYESVLTAFAGRGATVVFEEFPRDARRAVRVEKTASCSTRGRPDTRPTQAASRPWQTRRHPPTQYG
jgi:hypothetical protein